MAMNPANRIIGISTNAIISKTGFCIIIAGTVLISGSCTDMKNNAEIIKTDVILPSCDPGDVSEWINQTAMRRQELDNDFDQLNASYPDSIDDYIPYANRAKYRYNQQMSQSTPSCLSDVQDLVTEEAWLFWKFLDEASAGNINKAKEYGGSLVEITGRADEAMILAIIHTKPKTDEITAIPTPSTNRVTDPTQTTSTKTPSQASSSFSEPPTNQQLGNTWTRPADGMVVIFIPAGDLLMGSSDIDTQARSDEKPQHKVFVDAFWIDQTEVTNTMFARFIQMTNYQTTAEKVGSGWVYFPSTKKLSRVT